MIEFLYICLHNLLYHPPLINFKNCFGKLLCDKDHIIFLPMPTNIIEYINSFVNIFYL